MLSQFMSSVWKALKLNTATLSGCSDVIVIKKQDGSLDVSLSEYHVSVDSLPRSIWKN